MSKTYKFTWAIIGLICCMVFSSCHPDLELSDAQYYYVINSKYLLINNSVTELQTWDSTSKLHFSPSDYIIKDGNTYEIGMSYPTWEYEGEIHAYIKTNGNLKIWTEYHSALGPKFIEDGDDIYLMLDDRFETGETNRFGSPMYGYRYYISKNFENPEYLTEEKESEVGNRLVTIKKIKKFKDTFYFIGKRDRGGAFFCEADQLSTPYTLSIDESTAYDFCLIDTIWLICGINQDQACYWTWNGNSFDTHYYPVPDGTMSSCAYVIVQDGKDMYIGGRIGTKPAIWKNGEILAIDEEFPPHHIRYLDYYLWQYWFEIYSGCIVELKINGDKAYSIVSTDVNIEDTSHPGSDIMIHDNKLTVIEWDFSNESTTCKHKYDLVEMLTDGTIYLGQDFYHPADNMGYAEPISHTGTYWEKTYYTKPRILLKYMKDKRKK